jgi:transposase
MRHKEKKAFSESRKHSRFKVNNWSEYNDILRKRGRIDFMIAENLKDGWNADSADNRKPGGQEKYSDKAILMCLQIRCLFGLRLRQTQGFINWIFQMSGIALNCPDYTTMSKRCGKLNPELLLRNKETEFDYACMDSTGIQTYTGNEWLKNKHGKQYIRRTWKKLHISVGNDGEILAATTTAHNKDDRSQVQELLEDVKTKEVLADPGYDGENIYKMVRAKGIKPTMRPPNQQVAKQPKTELQQHAAYQKTHGYHAWRTKNNYGRRELVENTFFRFKTAFGSCFLSRNDNNMKNEMIIKCQLLNKMFEIGKPISTRAI